MDKTNTEVEKRKAWAQHADRCRPAEARALGAPLLRLAARPRQGHLEELPARVAVLILEHPCALHQVAPQR
jgi:hypothetical protein